jgi:hypothetical protein
MAAFDYRQAEEVRDAFARRGVEYLFLGKSAAILLGFPDTTQDVDLFPRKTAANGRAIVAALRELGFTLDQHQAAEIECGKDFVQIKSGPRWPASPCATPTTLSPASGPRTGRRTANPSPGSSRSAIIGSGGSREPDAPHAAHCRARVGSHNNPVPVPPCREVWHGREELPRR